MELEVKLMWCKGLTAFNFFQKLTIYASVSISSEDQKIQLTQEQKQEQKTPIDQDGDGNPEWNHTMTFDLNLLKPINPNFDSLSLVFEFRHHAQLFPDRTIGHVSVPLRSLVECVGSHVARFVSYEVRNPEGKHNGVVDFFYKVVGNVDETNTHSSGDNNSSIYISGYSHHSESQHWEHSHSHDHAHFGVHISQHQHIQYDHLNSGVHVSGDHHIQYDQVTHHHDHQQVLDGHPNSSDPEKIQYPKIDMEDLSAYVPANSASVNASIDQFYPAPHVVYPPPPTHLWGSPPPPQQPHFPHPPPPPAVYPPPPQPPYGDPHWGHHRPQEYQQQPGGGGGYDQYHHW